MKIRGWWLRRKRAYLIDYERSLARAQLNMRLGLQYGKPSDLAYIGRELVKVRGKLAKLGEVS